MLRSHDHSKSLSDLKNVKFAVGEINTGNNVSQILLGYGFELIQQCGGGWGLN